MGQLPVDAKTWNDLFDLAGEHGVLSLIMMAVEQLPVELTPELDELMELFGQSQMQRQTYRTQYSTAEKFAKALRRKGVEMKVLKGISFSTYYDQPELRECGDCDCYLSILGTDDYSIAGASGFEIGNRTIEEIGGKWKFGSYKHSHLFLDRLMFENHHYITDFNGTKRGKQLELLLERAIESAPGTKIGSSEMVRPCPYFNALHLIRHAQGNFILEGMSLRMIYDWAVFLRAEQDRLDWKKLYGEYESCGLREFADIMTSICVDYLGLEITSKNVTLCKDKSIVEEVLKDTLADKMHSGCGESFAYKVKRIVCRYKRIWHFRRLSIETVPMMIWNSFAFSSYMKREIELN